MVYPLDYHQCTLAMVNLVLRWIRRAESEGKWHNFAISIAHDGIRYILQSSSLHVLLNCDIKGHFLILTQCHVVFTQLSCVFLIFTLKVKCWHLHRNISDVPTAVTSHECRFSSNHLEPKCLFNVCWGLQQRKHRSSNRSSVMTSSWRFQIWLSELSSSEVTGNT